MADPKNISWLRDRVQQLENEVAKSQKVIGDLKQEKHFAEKVLDSLPGIFYLYDEDGRMIRWNKNHELLTGFSSQELCQRKIHEWFSEEDQSRVLSTVDKVLQLGKRVDIEAKLMITGGIQVPYFLTGVRMTVGLNKFLLGMGIDLTEQKKTEEALRKSEEKYRAIFENAVEGIYQTTPEGILVNCNRAMANLLGYASVDDLLASVKDVSRDMYVTQSARRAFLDLLQRNTQVMGYEVQFRRSTGQKIWVSLNAHSIADENGKLQLIEGIAIDITEKKHQEDLLREKEAYLLKENVRLRSNIKDRYRFGDIIGKSQVMQDVYELILKAAATDANTIIYGESGTGKELVARSVHKLSDRKRGRFVSVNCGAIPDDLVESEFFGYCKGAFTGAISDKQGYLDLADGGTLFMDELGEININLQVKLLRVLEGHGYIPVGGENSKKSDVRIIAATNRDLEELVSHGRMREDFYYRIHVIPIRIPPLRDRKEDIPLLIDHFLRSSTNDDLSSAIPGEMFETMIRHHWPGNVRELQNVLQRYRSLNQFDLLKDMARTPKPGKDKRGESQLPEFAGKSYHTAMADFEKMLLLNALEQHQWRRDDAARSVGLPLRTFYRKLKQNRLTRHKKRH